MVIVIIGAAEITLTVDDVTIQTSNWADMQVRLEAFLRWAYRIKGR